MFAIPRKLFTFLSMKCNNVYSESALVGAVTAAVPTLCVYKYFKSIIHAVVFLVCFLCYCTCQTEFINLYIYQESKQQDFSNPLPSSTKMFPSFFFDLFLIAAFMARYFAHKPIWTGWPQTSAVPRIWTYSPSIVCLSF